LYRAGRAFAERAITLPISDPDRVVALAGQADVRSPLGRRRTCLLGRGRLGRDPATGHLALCLRGSALPGVRRQLAATHGGSLWRRESWKGATSDEVVPADRTKVYSTAARRSGAGRRFRELEAKGSRALEKS